MSIMVGQNSILTYLIVDSFLPIINYLSSTLINLFFLWIYYNIIFLPILLTIIGVIIYIKSSEKSIYRYAIKNPKFIYDYTKLYIKNKMEINQPITNVDTFDSDIEDINLQNKLLDDDTDDILTSDCEVEQNIDILKEKNSIVTKKIVDEFVKDIGIEEKEIENVINNNNIEELINNPMIDGLLSNKELVKKMMKRHANNDEIKKMLDSPFFDLIISDKKLMKTIILGAVKSSK